MPDEFKPLDIAELNDLRRRIANDGEYTDAEVATAIHTLRIARIEESKKTRKKAAPKVVEKVNLDDLL